MVYNGVLAIHYKGYIRARCFGYGQLRPTWDRSVGSQRTSGDLDASSKLHGQVTTNGYGVIAAGKLKYRLLSLARISSMIEERYEQRGAAKYMKAVMRGLDEGYDLHMLDVADFVKQAWEGVSEKTIARCWIEVNILPRAVQG